MTRITKAAALGSPGALQTIMEKAALKRAGAPIRKMREQPLWKPPPKRPQTRVTATGELKTTPPDITENIIRVMRADPIGFLIAVMNGLPVPRRVADEFGRVQPVEYVTPEVKDRVLAAKELMGYIPVKLAKDLDKRVKPKITTEMERLVENAASSSIVEEGQD